MKATDFSAAMGRRIRTARKERGLTQMEMGELMGVTHVAISDIERGKTKLDIPRLGLIGALLGKSLAYFLPEIGYQAGAVDSADLPESPYLQVLTELLGELKRQIDKWGVQRHAPLYWLAILVEEVGEVGKAGCEGHWHSYRQELIHVAATALAAAECYDREGPPC